ncbi:MAG TPA: cob(I)yrinic acid a,c-diamide adenosyltransferase [Candidatus Alistipes merdigallinarum]|nr:cob(I)yrinic acid a,c-diamide adenosyltransferase [Candidatus Alistipes merdigallinarum]
MKVYTKTGDRGTTSLVGGERVAKTHPRIEAYGTIDELMSFTALLNDSLPQTELCAPYHETLTTILDHLMRIASHLAAETDSIKYLPVFDAQAVEFLEKQIDWMQASLPEIRYFTLPGGAPVVSLCHVCRTVCRRAERRICSLSGQCVVNECVTEYVNRLSDYFYVLGRKMSQEFHIKELLWQYDK